MNSIRQKMMTCKHCKSKIPVGANICTVCKSYQDWRNWIPFINTTVPIITALISVIGLVTPVLYKIYHEPCSDATISIQTIDGTTLRVIATNKGDAPAAIGSAWVSSDYLTGATKIRLKNNSDGIINPGNQLIVFDIIPALDEDNSYSGSLEMLKYVIAKKQAPRTEIRIQVIQSDGTKGTQTISLNAEQLFFLLRANADRCSAIKKADFENGCAGA